MNAQFIVVHVAEMLCFEIKENVYFALELERNLQDMWVRMTAA